MRITRTLAICVAFAFSAVAAHGQDRSRYRDFQLGSNLPSIASLVQIPAAGAKTVHARPAVIQELDWRPPYTMIGSTKSQNDPVERIVFSFYDNQLVKLV